MKEIFLKISILINIILIFFGYYLGNLFVIQFIAIAFAILGIKDKKVIINKDSKVWFIVLFFCVISLIYSVNTSETLKYIALFSGVLIIKIIYESSSNWQRFCNSSLLIASGIHVIATLLQLINPEFINNINSILLQPASYEMSQMLYITNSYSGITPQTSINAFYISIFITLIFVNLIINKKFFIIKILFFSLGVIALFLTAKRGMIIFNLICMMIMFVIISKYDKKRIFKIIFLLIIIALIVFLVLTYIPVASYFIEKLVILSENEDITNGRIELWNATLNVFSEHYILGVGINTIDHFINEYTHNIYIQLLAETGIIGFLIFLVLFIMSLIQTIIYGVSFFKNNENKYKKNIFLVSVYIQTLFLTYGFTGNPLYGHYFLITYALGIAMLNALKNDKRRE